MTDMHALRPNTDYRIATVQIAVPMNVDANAFADGMIEMLDNGMMASDAVYHDWSYAFSERSWSLSEALLELPTATTSAEPEEGELFGDVKTEVQSVVAEQGPTGDTVTVNQNFIDKVRLLLIFLAQSRSAAEYESSRQYLEGWLHLNREAIAKSDPSDLDQALQMLGFTK